MTMDQPTAVSRLDTATMREPAPASQDWLDLQQEDIIEPGLPIVDAHHHLREVKGEYRYLFDEMLEDVSSGHNIVASVFVQSGTISRSMYRMDGDPDLACIGETEFANGVAAMSASGAYGDARLCAAIVGWADMNMGADIRKVLEAHTRAGGDRFRGIRQPLTTLDPEDLRGALSQLARLGLLYEITLQYPDLEKVIKLASAYPDMTFVINHMGGPLNAGNYAGRGDELFPHWRRAVSAVAPCENVYMKIGGLGVPTSNFGFNLLAKPLSSTELSEAWRPYVETCVETFGARRCMMESNTPVDKGICSYPLLWNALKRSVAGASAEEKFDLFSQTAQRVYDIPTTCGDES